ncbi:hypothetical protein V6U90_05395 [Micromonospora sp. CPCC 206060]|uniref:hypothetical protein n=1 Tax=Micromonospora sp. CPCC 206060 TaxID=3122406 RepID=UPI002FF3F758
MIAVNPFRLFHRPARIEPLHVELNDTPERLAAALRGLAHFVDRRHDLDGQSIRITLTVRTGRRR